MADKSVRAPTAKDEAIENSWRKLALQFDEHRMNALSLLRAMVDDPEGFKDEAIKFLAAPPLSGEKVLANRIAEIASKEKQNDAI